MSPVSPASSVETFTVTCPAGTTSASPHVVATTVGPAELVHFEIDIPRGHAGLTGIQLRVAGGQVYPLTTGAWFIGDGLTIAQDVDQPLTSGAWQAYLYNTGALSHSWQIRYSIIDAALLVPLAASEPMASPIVV